MYSENYSNAENGLKSTNKDILLVTDESPRQDFTGGHGVFSNFFEEMAGSTANSHAENCAYESPISSDLFQQRDRFGRRIKEKVVSAQDDDKNLRDFYNECDPGFKILDHDGQNVDGLSDVPCEFYEYVKDCLDMVTLRRHAVKIVSKQGVKKIHGGWNQALHELDILLRLPPHPHVVRVFNGMQISEPDRVVIIMEFCLGSIHDLQAQGVPISASMHEQHHLDDLKEESLEDTDTAFGEKHTMQRIATEPILEDCLLSQGLNSEKDEVDGIFSRKISNIESNHRHDSRWPFKSSGATQAQQFRRLPEAQAHAFFLQIVAGLNYLHGQKIVHRDVKPGNLLLTPYPGCGLDLAGINAVNRIFDTGDEIDNKSPLHNNLISQNWSYGDLLRLSKGYIVKFTDFGVSASVADNVDSEMISGGQMTPAIQPPEVAKGVENIFQGSKLDVYSAGVSLFFMITGHVPFATQNVIQMFDVIAKGNYTIPGHVSVQAADVIRGMMFKDPKRRLSLKEVAQHPWLLGEPRPPPSLEQALKHCSEHWSQTTGVGAPPTRRSRGLPIWLDPRIYLKRPAVNFPMPHIDSTGARVFSKDECCENFTPSSAVDEVDGSTSKPFIQTSAIGSTAPISVIPKLKAYHNWPPSPSDGEDEDGFVRFRSHDHSQFQGTPHHDSPLQQHPLNNLVRNLQKMNVNNELEGKNRNIYIDTKDMNGNHLSQSSAHSPCSGGEQWLLGVEHPSHSPPECPDDIPIAGAPSDCFTGAQLRHLAHHGHSPTPSSGLPPSEQLPPTSVHPTLRKSHSHVTAASSSSGASGHTTGKSGKRVSSFFSSLSHKMRSALSIRRSASQQGLQIGDHRRRCKSPKSQSSSKSVSHK